MGLKEWGDFFHLGGLTQNYIEMNENSETYNSFVRPDIFYVYNYWSRKADVEQSNDYLALSNMIEKKLEIDEKLKDVDPEKSKWKEFFE